MFSLCKIIINLYVLFILFFLHFSFASVKELEVGASIQNIKNQFALYGLDKESDSNKTSQYLSFRNHSIFKATFLEINIQTNQADYSSLEFYDEKQNPYKLTNNNTELKATIIGKHDFSNVLSVGIVMNSDILESPFFSSGFGVNSLLSFYNQSTQIGFEWLSQFTKRPIDHYVNSELKTVSRSTSTQEHQFNISLEQTFTEYFKSKLTPKILIRNPDRPLALGVDLENSYFLNQIVYLKIGANYMGELNSISLKDERGYYSNYSFFIEPNFEITYSFILSFFYGLTIERENKPLLNETKQVGLDRYGIGTKLVFNNFNIKSNAYFDVTNTKYNKLGMEVGFNWNLN